MGSNGVPDWRHDSKEPHWCLWPFHVLSSVCSCLGPLPWLFVRLRTLILLGKRTGCFLITLRSVFKYHLLKHLPKHFIQVCTLGLSLLLTPFPCIYSRIHIFSFTLSILLPKLHGGVGSFSSSFSTEISSPTAARYMIQKHCRESKVMNVRKERSCYLLCVPKRRQIGLTGLEVCFISNRCISSGSCKHSARWKNTIAYADEQAWEMTSVSF